MSLLVTALTNSGELTVGDWCIPFTTQMLGARLTIFSTCLTYLASPWTAV